MQLITIEEAAEMLRVEVGTLRNWRVRNYGPKAARIGKYLRYRRSEIEEWAAKQFDDDRTAA